MAEKIFKATAYAIVGALWGFILFIIVSLFVPFWTIGKWIILGFAIIGFLYGLFDTTQPIAKLPDPNKERNTEDDR